MTENKRYDVIYEKEPRGQVVTDNGIPCTARTCCTRLNWLEEENKELKAKVDDKDVAVEVETCKVMEKIFDLIDEKIDELEKKYKFGQEVFKGCPMHNILHSINVLKELKKELTE